MVRPHGRNIYQNMSGGGGRFGQHYPNSLSSHRSSCARIQANGSCCHSTYVVYTTIKVKVHSYTCKRKIRRCCNREKSVRIQFFTSELLGLNPKLGQHCFYFCLLNLTQLRRESTVQLPSRSRSLPLHLVLCSTDYHRNTCARINTLGGSLRS